MSTRGIARLLAFWGFFPHPSELSSFCLRNQTDGGVVGITRRLRLVWFDLFTIESAKGQNCLLRVTGSRGQSADTTHTELLASL